MYVISGIEYDMLVGVGVNVVANLILEVDEIKVATEVRLRFVGVGAIIELVKDNQLFEEVLV